MLKYSILLICLLPISVSAEINKCLINGATVYTSKQCPKNTLQNIEIIESAESSSSSNVSENTYNSRKWYNDHEGYKKALAISSLKKAPLLIYGRTDWCPYCKRFENTLISNRNVKRVLTGFVKVQLNPEHSLEDKKLFNKWGGTGYPTLFIQSGEQRRPKQIRAPFIKQGTKWEIMSTKRFVSTLQEHLANY